MNSGDAARSSDRGEVRLAPFDHPKAKLVALSSLRSYDRRRRRRSRQGIRRAVRRHPRSRTADCAPGGPRLGRVRHDIGTGARERCPSTSSFMGMPSGTGYANGSGQLVDEVGVWGGQVERHDVGCIVGHDAARTDRIAPRAVFVACDACLGALDRGVEEGPDHPDRRHLEAAFDCAPEIGGSDRVAGRVLEVGPQLEGVGQAAVGRPRERRSRDRAAGCRTSRAADTPIADEAVGLEPRATL